MGLPHSYAKKVTVLQAQALYVNLPAILFANMQEEKKSSNNDKEAPTKKMKVKLDPMDKSADNKMEVCAFLFENGNAKSRIKSRIQIDKLTCHMPLTTGGKKTKVAKAHLKGQAREYFMDIFTDFKLNDNNKNDREEYFAEAIEGLGR